MTITSYETKEQTADGFRAIVVTPFEQGSGRVDFVTADDQRHVIDLEDLAFLVRAGASLPRHLLEPTALAQVVAPMPVVDEEPKAKKTDRPARAGGRWTDQEESIRLDQAVFFTQIRFALMSAFASSMSFLIRAVRATFGGLPALIMA